MFMSRTRRLLVHSNQLKFCPQLSIPFGSCSRPKGTTHIPNKLNSTTSNQVVPPKLSSNPVSNGILKRFGPDALVASENYNRYLLVPPAIAIHLCLGGIYSWSLFNSPLTRELGIVTSVAGDWTVSSVVPVFSTIILFHGTSGALFGKWSDKVGPKIAQTIGGIGYAGGIMLGSYGISIHSLPLIYLGYGVIGGLGHGICYISPISTLIKWFPDRPGLATGMVLCGLGGGAIAATPIIDRIIKNNFNAPTYIGDESIISTLNVITDNKGQYFIDPTKLQLNNNNSSFVDATLNTTTSINDNLQQIVQVHNNELIQSGFSDELRMQLIDKGWYLLDNIGNTGAATTMFSLGIGYLGIIGLSSLFMKLPNPNSKYLIQNQLKIQTSQSSGLKNNDNNSARILKLYENKKEINLTVEEAIRTPQFWLMWISLFTCSTAGMGVISTAKTMMSEVFSQSFPHIVTASFASTYVMAISASNLLGRFGWGNISDKIGYYNTFKIFGLVGCGLYLAIPFYIQQSIGISIDSMSLSSMAPLIAFYGSTLLLFSFFGGGFAVMPPYEAKIFGRKNVGAIHGKMMTAIAGSGVLGPLLITKLRDFNLKTNIIDLSEKIWNVDNGLYFKQSFCNKNLINENIFDINKLNINELIDTKVLTVSKLMDCVSKLENEMNINLNIIDPTPFLYDSTMYAMSGIMATCAIANFCIKRCKLPNPNQNQTENKRNLDLKKRISNIAAASTITASMENLTQIPPITKENKIEKEKDTDENVAKPLK